MAPVADLIAKKRDGGTLSESEVQDFINGVVKGDFSDAQIGAMLMAIYLNGMNDTETSTLTKAMLGSGEVMEWDPEWKGTLVDKHSTGGVGEKTSLILAPALAACGLRVPMISGRGLGHTGGTIDKLESIPGFRTDFSTDQMRDILRETGCFIVNPTRNMVPADKVLYAQRDITSTIESVPLITGSIMSKKGAESLDALLLMLTFGKAAFMKTEEHARTLGKTLMKTGRSQGTKTTGMLFSMDNPLGKAVGNSLEILETIECLKGESPLDLHNAVCAIGAHLLFTMGRVETISQGEAAIDKVIKDGSAKKKFIEMAVAQGADPKQMDLLFTSNEEARKIMPTSKHITNLCVEQTGFIQAIEALTCGYFCQQLGAGRAHPSDIVNPRVGLMFRLQVGDCAKKGDVWVEIHHDNPLTDDQIGTIKSAIDIGPEPLSEEKLIRIVEILN